MVKRKIPCPRRELNLQERQKCFNHVSMMKDIKYPEQLDCQPAERKKTWTTIRDHYKDTVMRLKQVNILA
jgi:hypothetical protein